MTRDELRARITVDPNVCFGKPCVRGHRIWVSLVLDWLAGGMTFEQIKADYDLADDDIRACIAYAAEICRERRVLDWLADGMTFEQIRADHGMTDEDIRNCIANAAGVCRKRRKGPLTEGRK